MLAETYTHTVQPCAYGTEKHTIRVWYIPYAYGIIIIIIIISMDTKNRNKQFVLLGQRPLMVSTSCHLPVIIEEIFEGIGCTIRVWYKIRIRYTT